MNNKNYNSTRSFMSTLKNVKIMLRDFIVLEGEIKLIDKHFNLIIKKDDREIFIRGDSIVYISR